MKNKTKRYLVVSLLTEEHAICKSRTAVNRFIEQVTHYDYIDNPRMGVYLRPRDFKVYELGKQIKLIEHVGKDEIMVQMK